MEVDAEKLYLIVGGENYPAFRDIKNCKNKYDGKANCIAIYGGNPPWAYADRIEEPNISNPEVYPLTEELYWALLLFFPPLDRKGVTDFGERRVEVAKFLKDWGNNLGSSK